MSNKTINPHGIAEVNVPANQSIAISNFGGGIAQIFYLIESANFPDQYKLQQTLENSSVTLGPFSAGKTVKIEAGNSRVIYDVGASPDTGIGNADRVGGYLPDTTATASTVAVRDSNADITARVLKSGVSTGTSPLTVSSTTVVPNLNSSRLNGYVPSESGVNSTIPATNSSGDTYFSRHLYVGVNASATSIVHFRDVNSAAWRALFWNEDFYIQDNSGTNRKLYHAGDNASLAAGNGISGTFTTADGKTVTVTNGIITAITGP